jgi:hypothetical protein
MKKIKQVHIVLNVQQELLLFALPFGVGVVVVVVVVVVAPGDSIQWDRYRTDRNPIGVFPKSDDPKKNR